MPRIPSYPLIGQISNDDLLIIDDVSQQYATKSVQLQSLKGYFNTGQATTTYVDDKVVSGASFDNGDLTLTRTDGVDVTQNLDGRYALASAVFSGNYNDLTNKPTTITEAQASAIETNSGKTSFPGFGTTQGTALEGDTVIPPAYTNADVDNHLNKNAQTQNGYVLSLSNNDYTWVAQSGGGGGTVTSIETSDPITGGPITGSGTIGISQASTSADGYLSSADWNTFNSKQSTSEKGEASGYAPLDANQKVPTDNLPDSIIGAVVYQGTWNASTNTPTLPPPATANNGHYYIVSDAGTYSGITYAVGDWAISNGIAWEKVDNTQDVNSVFGRQGNVVANASDYSSFYDANVQSNWDEEDVNSDAFILNKPATITQTQANEIAANTLKTSFPGFGTTAGTALEGNTVIPTNTSDLNNDSGFIEGTTATQTAITEIKTLTLTEYQSENKQSNVMYVIV